MMSTNQPQWKLLANLGDVNPIDYGGYFVYVDTTGEYGAEAELLIAPDDDESPEGWIVYRFGLDKCTFADGILSDNRFHPELSAWFAKPENERANRPQDTTYLSNVGDCDLDELRRMFCSDDPLERAHAYRAVGDYHGFDNLDSYPLHFSARADVEARYRDKNGDGN